MGTLKEQLDAALAKVTLLEGEKSDLSAQVEEAGTKITKLEGDKDALSKKVTALEGEKTTLTARVEQLDSKDQSAAARAREQLSGAGVNSGGQKPEPGKIDASNDPAALWDTYSKASSIERARMRTEHGTKLDAAAAAYERAQLKA